MSKYFRKICIVLLFVFSLLSVFWMLSAENSFCFDDTSWLLKISTSSYPELFSFFPHSAYLDRPIGIIFLKLLYSLFGLDYGRHHAVLVGIHLFNVLLVYSAFKGIVERKYNKSDNSFQGGLITAAFFGCWSLNHMAVQWDSAIFDLLGCSFSLLAIWFYLRYRNNKEYKTQNVILFLFFYYLAIRTKEMFLVLPLLVAIYEIWEMLLERKREKFSSGLKISLAIFILFFTLIVLCKLQGSITNEINNPYYQSFAPLKLFQNLLRYCMLCFDVENTGWNYSYSLTGLSGLILMFLGFIAAIWNMLSLKRYELFLCFIAIVISISTVLPMVNQVHALYLYFPSIFVGLLIACIVEKINIQKKGIISLVCMCIFMLACFSKRDINTRNYWLSNAAIEKKVWDDISAMEMPVPETNIYIRNMQDSSYTPFFYGEGGVCKLLFNDPSLKIIELKRDEVIKYKAPYIVWNYENGHIKEIERNNNRTLDIKEVYSALQPEGVLYISVVPDKIDGAMTIYIDGLEHCTIVGENFISTQLSADLFKGKKEISLFIEDQYGVKSDKYILKLQ